MRALCLLLAAGQAAATVHLCGDSTMARGNASSTGGATRSFTREGRFDEVLGQVQNGDWVVIEFGHNDGGSLSSDNGRSACFGDGEETCQTTYNGVAETVHTFPWYLKQASTKFLAKGAKVILSETTPNNPWEGGSFSWGPSRFFYYTWLASAQLGGPDAGAGAAVVNAGFPQDHTHTGPAMADMVSQSFVLGLACGTSALASNVKNSTADLTSGVLGPCISSYNSTVVELLR
ncbi:unnamed protein product [Parascedosporium putredinis]|uniref:Rhamnogalacturonan acetylesterase n=1 Tax=Parascedosporium putredinis TaxID=1442378 RepID=A0A9P1GXU1_9PEZI|nr:unnamed protein product [Parascedosporium putredinis]CAI7990146.1 unnamed protein product [Parascedosporium putredinis]